MARHAGAPVAVYWGRLSRVLTSGQVRKSLNLMRQSPGATSSTVMNHVLRWATSQSFWLGPSLQCSGRAEHSTIAVGTFCHLLSVPLGLLVDVRQTTVTVARRPLASRYPISMTATSAVALCVPNRAGGCGLFQGTATTLRRPLAYRANWRLGLGLPTAQIRTKDGLIPWLNTASTSTVSRNVAFFVTRCRTVASASRNSPSIYNVVNY